MSQQTTPGNEQQNETAGYNNQAIQDNQQNNQSNRVEAFSRALAALEEAPAYAKKTYQTDVFQQAARLMDLDNGAELLYGFVDRFENAGAFQGGPWDEPAKLQPQLVKGTLRAGGNSTMIEIMNQLRMLSLSRENHTNEQVSPEGAQAFLNEVLVLNLDTLFPEETEAARIEGQGKEKDRAVRLFKFLADELSLATISGTLVKEIERLTAQRSVMVNRVETIITKAKELLDMEIDEKDRRAVKKYTNAISGPSKKSRELKELSQYREWLKQADDEKVQTETDTFADLMRDTGLVSPHHAILVRFLNNNENRDLLSRALGLNNKGRAGLEEFYPVVKQLITVAIHPPTRQTVYGLARMLERGVLSSPPVIPGLRRLIELDIKQEVKEVLLRTYDGDKGLTANDILMAGVISVLGQPLGVGQGMNPTCQTARGVSLWSIHAPDYLLELISRGARDADIDINFEGFPIHSKDLTTGLFEELHEELDPVSLILVPHLDRIYAELVRRSGFRGEDVHKWVNPAFYGNWVPRGFSSFIDPMTNTINNFAGFVRLFYATHHPDYNNGHELIYPNPVGIFITNSFANLYGLHAVSIQRIAKDSHGEYRIYFYNPNNDSSQNWGQGIEPQVTGNGEEPGESSLPFHKFLARLYAFHYNPYEQGDAYAVDDETVSTIENMARESWGQNYTWV